MATPVPLLFVEDEPDLREAVEEYLSVCGFQVTSVASAEAALAAAFDSPPRILLTDLTLPDRRGDSFLGEFHEHYPHCLLYVHSGDSSFVPGPSLTALGLTADHVFSKPADLGEMVARFHAHLAIL